MSELRECPFCGGDVRYEVMMDGAYSFACPDCGLNASFPECFTDRDGSTRIWNTRAERTCRKVPGKMHYGERRPKCSECGYGLEDPRWTYCPSCGAKVTELQTAIEDAIGEVIERYPNTMDMLGDK